MACMKKSNKLSTKINTGELNLIKFNIIARKEIKIRNKEILKLLKFVNSLTSENIRLKDEIEILKTKK